jgi:hypothetical protein
MSGKRIAIVTVLIAFAVSIVGGSLYAAKKGEFYLMEGRKVLTERAGIPCNENENSFCLRNSSCKPGHIARGMIMNIDDKNGAPTPAGFGLTCADPNELYKTYEVGSFGENFGGKVFRDICDAGFYLAGAHFYTNDRKSISGGRAVCRRYWPVEQRDGTNVYGAGLETKSLVCDPGQFVSGIKLSYWRTEEDGEMETGIYSTRFYCAEMREYLGLPKKKKDPRDPKRH